MHVQVRRVVALVAASLVSGKQLGTIHDAADNTATRVTGEVRRDIISLYDHDRSDYVVGFCPAPHQYELSDLCSTTKIHLELDGHRFSGLDGGSNKPFSGQVEGNTIILYDEEDAHEHRFTI